MDYLTDRKRATGLGSAREGTHHHISMMISSVALIVLMPLFILTFGSALGGGYDEILAYYARPFPAIVAVLTMLVALHHFNGGVQSTIEDYTSGMTRKALLMFAALVSYGAAAIGVFAIAKIAL